MIYVMRVQFDFRNWRIILFLSRPSRPFGTKPECKMGIRILCVSERDRGLTGLRWNVKKEGQSRAQKPIL